MVIEPSSISTSHRWLSSCTASINSRHRPHGAQALPPSSTPVAASLTILDSPAVTMAATAACSAQKPIPAGFQCKRLCKHCLYPSGLRPRPFRQSPSGKFSAREAPFWRRPAIRQNPYGLPFSAGFAPLVWFAKRPVERLFLIISFSLYEVKWKFSLCRIR